MRLRPHRALRSERGFTLVEILVAMTMALVVLASTFTILDLFNQHYTQSNQRTDAQDRARWALDRIAWELRNTATETTATGSGTSTTYAPTLLERATPWDIVFDTVIPYSSLGLSSYGSNTSQVVRLRYCVPNDTSTGTSSAEVVYQQIETWTTSTPPTSPWGSSTSTTYPCPDTSSVSNNTVVVQGVTNRYLQRTDRPLFYYDGFSTPANGITNVKTVQMDLFANPTPTNSGTESEIKSGTDVRASADVPSAYFTTTSEGTGKVLLNAEAYSPDNNQVTYAWSCSGSNCPTSGSNVLNATSAQYEWSPGTGTDRKSVV